MKAIAILTSPTGDRFFEAYGPMSKNTSMATVFNSKEIAERAAGTRFGRTCDAVWNSERDQQAYALKNYNGWTVTVLELSEGESYENRDGIARLTPAGAQRYAVLAN